jgi:hypothetical protein
MTKQRFGLKGAAIAGLLVLAVAAFVPPVAPAAFAPAAASSFTGGAVQWPTYVPNDHTPIAVQFSADASGGLLPSTTYGVKIRFTTGTSPSPTTNRGYTWNPATNEWVHERDSRGWSAFPSVSTDASGAISASSGWVFAKFGDDAKSGDYHIMVSLSATSSSTMNSSILPTVTVFDVSTAGSWLHNGVATGKAASKRAAITDATGTAVLALNKTEAQLLDDDSNGGVDDEDWGPAGATGDFRMSVPASTPVGVNLNQSVWAPGSGFVSGPADVDLAVGAADAVAPSAPGPVSGTAGDATATIEWGSASDGTGVAGYHVYRWTPLASGSSVSPVHSRIATVGPAETTFSDSGLTNGATYCYEVRAFDAATNVGPRSGTATVTPVRLQAVAQVAPSAPDGENGWYVTTPTVTLQMTPGRTGLYSFEAAPSVWTTYTIPFDVPTGTSTLLYRETDGVTMTATETAVFHVDMTAPTASALAPMFSVPLSASRTFRVAWVGSDAHSGAANYDVEYKTNATGAWIPWRASTAEVSGLFTGALGSSNYFRVRSADAAGNVGQWSAAACTVVPYDHGKARFSGSWKTVKNSAYYLGSSRYCTKKGGSATLSFAQGTLYVVAKTGPKMGKMAVYLGRSKVGTVNLYSRTTKARQVVKLLSRGAGASAKTVKLVNLGVRGRTRVEIDGFAFKN